jgi:3-oxoacyl-[acyl-carrier protein] reductase
MRKALVLAGSRGIGRAIADALKTLEMNVIATSSTQLDTSNIDQVKQFIEEQKETDVLVLNTGGPPAKDFFTIKEEDWAKYYNQLFLSFCLFLQGLTIKRGGYVFLISSFNLKEPDPKLILSNAYRIAFVSVLKSVSKLLAEQQVSCVNIAPGPIKTDRLFSLVDNMEATERGLPLKRAGKPEEIGNFVKAIIEYDIKYLNGVTINFDGGLSNYVL